MEKKSLSTIPDTCTHTRTPLNRTEIHKIYIVSDMNTHETAHCEVLISKNEGSW